MVDSLWFVLALVLLAVVSVALVLVLVLRREEAHGGRETRTEYLQPTTGRPAGSASRPRPAMKPSFPTATGSLRGRSRRSTTTLCRAAA